MNKPLIVSWTPGKKEAEQRAQERADRERKPMALWEHVGLYGLRWGDIPAQHTFKIQPLDAPNPPAAWALIAIADPVL